mmetsp:Transcript_170680/g.547483  ORF Transcript_170680/g.547483 Transcript_170680/m.547483 type:complete len:216 (+) Transcript_170680:1366-2013(+)
MVSTSPSKGLDDGLWPARSTDTKRGLLSLRNNGLRAPAFGVADASTIRECKNCLTDWARRFAVAQAILGLFSNLSAIWSATAVIKRWVFNSPNVVATFLPSSEAGSCSDDFDLTTSVVPPTRSMGGESCEPTWFPPSRPIWLGDAAVAPGFETLVIAVGSAELAATLGRLKIPPLGDRLLPENAGGDKGLMCGEFPGCMTSLALTGDFKCVGETE